jgi:ATP-dependent DNA helicase RecG
VPVDVVKISPHEAEKVKSTPEHHFADIKSKEISPAKLSKTVSAFANADGGDLYVGIDEDTSTRQRAWNGFASIEAANGHLQLFEKLFPLGQDFSYQFLESADRPGLLLHLTIRKTPDIKFASDGIAYVRRGAQSLPCNSHEDLKRLEFNKGVTSFETQFVDADAEVVLDSATMAKFIESVVPHTDAPSWAKKQQIVRQTQPTVAGVILFADEPQSVLPKRCGIKVYRYLTSGEPSRETLAFDPLTIEGCVYDQIEASVSKVVAIVEELKTLNKGEFQEISYPFRALHEIITNALLHRDYSIPDDVHVRIFDNRIEVESPGKLPGHITEQNILDERFARNPSIVRLINKFPNPPNKDVGEGLNTAFDAMRQLKLKEPKIQQRDNSVLVNIRHEPIATPEELVMRYLEDNEVITNTIGRKVCYIGSDSIMRKVFQRLMENGLIERVPEKEGRAAAYRRKR